MEGGLGRQSRGRVENLEDQWVTSIRTPSRVQKRDAGATHMVLTGCPGSTIGRALLGRQVPSCGDSARPTAVLPSSDPWAPWVS